jgi:hypothetical protein
VRRAGDIAGVEIDSELVLGMRSSAIVPFGTEAGTARAASSARSGPLP